MAKLRMQKEQAPSGRKMASIIFDKVDVKRLKELIERNPKGFFMSNIQILKPGEKV